MSQTGIGRRYELLDQPSVVERLRREFRRLNRFMVVVWRLGFGPLFGRFTRTAGRILILHHIGRRSGTVFQSPVSYADVDGELFCVAAFGERSDWYRNLMARPQVEAWLPMGRSMVEVADVSHRPDRVALIREVLISSGFAAPAFGLHPQRMSDETLQAATADYRVLQITPLRPLPGSVADLRWIWLVAGGVLAMWALMTVRSRRRTGHGRRGR